MAVYYNEFDPFAAAWLRELIKEGAIPDGEVDERSILDVRPDDVKRFTQCHWFAGIGGWAYALRLAGWGDRPVWTGSCPCQPFSAAGANIGGNDPRHLWPAWFRLIQECRPRTIFGEQVAAALNHGWLDLVFDDLEREGYAAGAVGLPACSVGAFHIRQRVWFVADSGSERRQQDAGGAFGDEGPHGRQPDRDHVASGDGEIDVADSNRGRRKQRDAGERLISEPRAGVTVDDLGDPAQRGQRIDGAASGHTGHADEPSPADGLGHGLSAGLEGHAGHGGNGHQPGRLGAGAAGSTATAGGARELVNAELSGAARLREHGGADGHQAAEGDRAPGFWSDVEWIACRDGKARPTQPGLFPLAHGVSNRVGTLRGAGNAIIPALAAEVIRAYMAVVLDSN